MQYCACCVNVILPLSTHSHTNIHAYISLMEIVQVNLTFDGKPFTRVTKHNLGRLSGTLSDFLIVNFD